MGQDLDRMIRLRIRGGGGRGFCDFSIYIEVSGLVKFNIVIMENVFIGNEKICRGEEGL